MSERRYRYKLTGILGVIAWETESEVGIDCEGFTWTGTRDQFDQEWESMGGQGNG